MSNFMLYLFISAVLVQLYNCLILPELLRSCHNQLMGIRASLRQLRGSSFYQEEHRILEHSVETSLNAIKSLSPWYIWKAFQSFKQDVKLRQYVQRTERSIELSQAREAYVQLNLINSKIILVNTGGFLIVFMPLALLFLLSLLLIPKFRKIRDAAYSLIKHITIVNMTGSSLPAC